MSAIIELKHYLSQILGWHTKRRIVVVESDDWGSIRMPSKEIYNKYLSEGYRVDLCHFSRYDSLETENDLNLLMDVLSSVKDKEHNPVIFTANSVVANPDFEKIANHNFQKYYFESVLDTYQHQSGCERTFDVIKQGMNARLWHPQSHGREHLNVNRWLKALRNNDEITHACFSDCHFSFTSVVSPQIKARYMDAFANADLETLEEEKNILREGLDMFKDIFGFRSESFIAPCYTWRSELEETLASCGIKYLQGLAYQQIPISDEPFKCKSKFHKLGEKNKYNQIYLIRNVFFEPYKGQYDWKNECLHRIDIAFKCYRPAIISSHRLNFIGSLDPSYRDKNLREFSSLLKSIVKLWPDVEFMSSDRLGEIIYGE